MTKSFLLTPALICLLSISLGCGHNSQHMPVDDSAQGASDASGAGGTDPGVTSTPGAGTGAGTPSGGTTPPPVNAPLYTYAKNIVPIFKKRCSLCHNGQGLLDWTVYKNASAKSKEIANRITLPPSNPQSMPYGNNSTGLTTAERDLILEWIKAGAPK